MLRGSLAAYGEGVLTAFLVLHLIARGVDAGAGLGGAASVYTIFAAIVLVCRVVAAGVVDRVRPYVIASAGFAAEAAAWGTEAAHLSAAVAAAGAGLWLITLRGRRRRATLVVPEQAPRARRSVG